MRSASGAVIRRAMAASIETAFTSSVSSAGGAAAEGSSTIVTPLARGAGSAANRKRLPASSIRSPSFSGVGAAMLLPFTAVPLPLPRSSMK